MTSTPSPELARPQAFLTAAVRDGEYAGPWRVVDAQGNRGLVAVTDEAILLAGQTTLRSLPLSPLSRRDDGTLSLRLTPEHEVPLGIDGDADALVRAVAVQVERYGDELLGDVPPERVATLPELPGHRIIRTLGLVSQVTPLVVRAQRAGAGVAEPAGVALPTEELRARAAALGGNAVVGVSASVVPAHGGGLSLDGKEPAAVLMLGTAARVRPA